MGAERARLRGSRRRGSGVAGLGSVPVRAGLGHRPGGLQRPRHRLGLLPARPRPLAGLPLERRRPGRDLRRAADVLLRARPCGTARTRSSRSASSGWAGRRATTARTPRSTGGTSTRPRRTRSCAGATTTRRAGSRTATSCAPTRARGRQEPEFELVDTGIFDEDRYWAVTVDYAKASPTDMCVTITDREPRTRGGHRCTCCRRCGSATPGPGGCPAGTRCRRSTATTRAPWSPSTASSAGSCWPARTSPRRWCCDNESNAERLWGLDEPVAVPEGRHQRLHRGR